MLLCADTEELLHFVQISIASTSGPKQDLQERANRFSHNLHRGKVGSSQKVSQVAQRRSVAQAIQHPRNFFSLRAGLLPQLQHCFCPLDCIITTSNVSGSGSAEAVGWDTNRNASQKSYRYNNNHISASNGKESQPNAEMLQRKCHPAQNAWGKI